MKSWNQRLKHIAGALELKRGDIAAAVRAGGLECSGSMAHAWMSAPSAEKVGVHGQTVSKYREMAEAEFDAFLRGLRTTLDAINDA